MPHLDPPLLSLLSAQPDWVFIQFNMPTNTQPDFVFVVLTQQDFTVKNDKYFYGVVNLTRLIVDMGMSGLYQYWIASPKRPLTSGESNTVEQR